MENEREVNPFPKTKLQLDPNELNEMEKTEYEGKDDNTKTNLNENHNLEPTSIDHVLNPANYSSNSESDSDSDSDSEEEDILASIRSKEDEKTFKVLILGSPQCGKTSIVKRIAFGIFREDYNPTIGCDFVSKSIAYNETQVQLSFFDIGGQDRYHELTRAYYNGAQGAFILCDISRRTTIQDSLKWRTKIYDAIPNLPIILLINKCDLMDEPTEKTNLQEAQKFAQDNQFSMYYFISVKNDTNITQAILQLIDSMIQAPERQEVKHTDSIKLTVDPKVQKKNNDGNCCN